MIAFEKQPLTFGRLRKANKMIEKNKHQFKAVVPNLFLTVAHCIFLLKNFPWPYSQSIAQLQFSTILSSSVARIS